MLYLALLSCLVPCSPRQYPWLIVILHSAEVVAGLVLLRLRIPLGVMPCMTYPTC